MSIEYQCATTLLKNKGGAGILNYKELSKINIDKFMEEENSYYTSDELWNIAVQKHRTEIMRESERIAKEENSTKRKVINEYRRQFQYRIYEASIIEAICVWNIKNAKDYAFEYVSDEEDYNNKIDIKFRHRETQICFNIQVKKWKKHIDTNKRVNELIAQINAYGAPALYFEIEFSEKDRTKRRFVYEDKFNVLHEINFANSFGRGKEFHQKFVELLDYVVLEQQLKQNVEYYEKNHIIF